MKEIIDIFSGLLVPLTTLIMVYIAYQQMKANRIKVKYNLYADREKIFDATMEFIGLVFTDGVAQRKDINDFLRKTNKSKFLLGKKVSNYLDTLRENARKLLGWSPKVRFAQSMDQTLDFFIKQGVDSKMAHF